ncbi:MAG: hypothetical protein WAJ85_12815 [Candidatus Baltobacteraceae bacterium]
MADPTDSDKESFAERFDVVRVERPSDLPPRHPRAVEVALLDMNHGFPNVGHDAIVALVRDVALGLGPELARSDRFVRLLSYAVRDRLMLPDHAQRRHRLYLGTGGPGHHDPRHNTHDDGIIEIREDPSWEAPLWRLFDEVAADEDASLFGVCHTFGLICRWLRVAEPMLRGPEKGGLLNGIGTNVLTGEALAHPWFGRLAAELASEVVTVLDSRYYDLVPTNERFPEGIVPIAYESKAHSHGDRVLTMLEVARERGAAAPRIFAVNSHPEIGTAERIAEILERLHARGELTPDVYEARKAMLPVLRDESAGPRLRAARATFDDLVRHRLELIVAA